MSTRDDPISLHDALEAVGQDLGLPPVSAIETVRTVVTEVVGPDLAAHARVRSVRDGTCTIEVEQPVWASRIRYVANAIRSRVNERLGASFLTSVRVVVSAPRDDG